MRLGLYPLVISEGSKQQFHIESDWESIITKRRDIKTVTVRSSLDFLEGSDVEFTLTGKGLAFEYTPTCTGEHTVYLYREKDQRIWPENPYMEFRFYVTPEKFKGKFPFKGDLHLHSIYSDGREAPLLVAAECREKGMDFAALTDHHDYEASLLAIKAAEEVDMDILLLKGEEISPHYGLGHIVSIGADRFLTSELVSDDVDYDYGDGMDGWLKGMEAKTAKMWEKYHGLFGEIPEGVHERMYTYFCGIISEIRKAGGFAIFAHPYWPSTGAMDIFRKTADFLLEKGHFDALELMGDTGYQKGFTFLNRFIKESDHPYVSSSDAHSQDNVAERYSIIFTKSLTEETIKEAVLKKQCIAATKEKGDLVLFANDPELQEFGYFLENNFFPKAELLKKGQGIAYKTFLAGYTGDDSAFKKHLNEYYEKCFNW